MASPIRAALTLRRADAVGYDEPRDAIARDWVRTAESWDMVPLLVPNGLSDPAKYLSDLAPDLLILTGGEDPGVDSLRDATEAALVDRALETALPVFGVCRGLQFLNGHFGGGLLELAGHIAAPHPVSFSPPLDGIYGAEGVVNSFHGRGIGGAELASDLVPVARDGDGNIEAAVHATRPLAAVMWHPERPGGENAVRRGDAVFAARLVQDGAFWA